jgi:hypothetical protein
VPEPALGLPPLTGVLGPGLGLALGLGVGLAAGLGLALAAAAGTPAAAPSPSSAADARASATGQRATPDGRIHFIVISSAGRADDGSRTLSAAAVPVCRAMLAYDGDNGVNHSQK